MDEGMLPGRSTSMWFVLGVVVLVIGSMYILGSYFLYAMGSGSNGNAVGLVGFVLAVVGAAVAVGSATSARSARTRLPTTGRVLNK